MKIRSIGIDLQLTRYNASDATLCPVRYCCRCCFICSFGSCCSSLGIAAQIGKRRCKSRVFSFPACSVLKPPNR
jgi:hypothetical protein